MTEAIVELRDVFCVHRTGEGDAAALQGAELAVSPAEVLCAVGPSGAGKSTLLRVIAGLQTPSAGVVRVMGEDIGRQNERARAAFRNRHLGVLSESSDAALAPDLPIADSVELPLALRGQGTRRGRSRRALELLESVGLADRARALPYELSGGERQRVALCTAIAHRPALLLADEPTGELDSLSAEQILELIAHVARASEMSVIVATHDPRIAHFADRTVTISGGRIAEESTQGETALVVSEGGWIRLPPRLRRASGIGSRALVADAATGVIVRSAAGPDHSPTPAATSLGLSDDWSPAHVGVRSLTFAYGHDGRRRTVLDGMSHDFAPGRMTAVTGRSGSGKSTLLKLLAGLERPDAGDVTVDRWALSTCDREQLARLRRERIGYMAQEPTAVAFLSALENLLVALDIRGFELDDARSRAASVLAALRLFRPSRQRVSRLSAGETQRVALARALAGGRGLIVLDEPTSRLDEANAAIVADVLALAVRDRQTIVCATHDPQVIDAADDVVELV
jgi:ABC-type lipoprotein export system ATPase subunit